MSNEFSHIPDEVWILMEAVCEDRISPSQAKRLEQLVLADAAIRRLYVDYITLHGTLHWDTAMSAEFPNRLDDSNGSVDAIDIPQELTPVKTTATPATRRWRVWSIAGLAACGLVLIGAFAHRTFFASKPGTNIAVKPGDNRPEDTNPNNAAKTNPAPSKRGPLRIGPNDNLANRKPDPRQPVEAIHPKIKAPLKIPAGGSDTADIVAFLNDRFSYGWKINEVKPSEVATDSEWVRRAYLDLIGRIPTVTEVETFLADNHADKREILIDKLLDDPRYVRHWATVWSNLLVGRKPSRDVNRPQLETFLRDSFAKNRPWKDVVVDLIAAEGSVEENGAANYLVAHLNNQAVPATAVTARLFLGMQVQCTQCHNHPFNDWKQNQFWELNGFFKQTAAVREPAGKGKKRTVKLVTKKTGGPTYYETRNQVLIASFPKFAGEKINPEGTVNRRAELARLMFEDDSRQVAKAFVNRLWAHFHGYSFTRSVDDMGPHNPPTHPEVLDRLTDEFVASGYDVKRLIRWICNSRPYQLTSRFNETNTDDDPDRGQLPLFSRMYVKAMSVEQLYDSLLVATKAHLAKKGNWDEAERQRRDWLQQFVYAHQTEENDESTTFDGTIPQALLMMNSDLVQKAVSGEPGTLFHEVLASASSDNVKVRKLCMAALSRNPSEKELAAIRTTLRRPVPRNQVKQARFQTMQDLFWAYLNSNEFMLIH